MIILLGPCGEGVYAFVWPTINPYALAYLGHYAKKGRGLFSFTFNPKGWKGRWYGISIYGYGIVFGMTNWPKYKRT
jgi:hypothetical protein